ncbi:MAG TPA: protein kinase [Thermoanaerobaculia bacterium]|nr:protein kinase [Thermoanaerobaculia bacterium]
MTAYPSKIDRFTIVRLIGRGGMGMVYLAEDPRLGRKVALKVLSDYDLPDKERRARFLREARAAAAIRHPNVATIYEVGETPDGLPFIAMEFCEGETLSAMIQIGTISGKKIVRIARQAAEAIAAAHQRGIVHRDIKSANIMVEPGDIVKVLDFGLAKVNDLTPATSVAETSASGNFFGTIPYLSPEQTRGLPADARSDLFSLGTVFYEMATGNLPFNADIPLMMLEKIRDSEPEPFVPLDPTLSIEMANIIGHLLKKNPAERYQSAEQVAGDLLQLETAVSANQSDRPSIFRKTSLGRTRARGVNWLAAAALIMVAASAASIAWFASRQGQKNGAADTRTKSGPMQSIAVLPFQNISGTATEDFLSVGFADALTTQLQQLPTLRVRPTSAVLQFAKNGLDPTTASERLKVDGVVEGRFLSDGNQVRVNVQLTDSRSGFSIWADTIQGKRGDLIRLMDDVSSKTTAALHKKLSLAETAVVQSEPTTTSPEAYENFLKARSLSGTLIPAESAQEVEYLKKAVALDSKFAAAYAELAITLSLRQARGLEKSSDSRTSAEGYAREAVRLDPNLPAAHLALGRTLIRFPDRFAEATLESLAALRLNPNDTQSLHTIVTYFASIGDLDKVKCLGDRLVSINPTSAEARTRAYWYVNAADGETARALADPALESHDTELAGHDILALAALQRGDIAAAEKEQKKASQLVPDHYIGKSLAAMIAAAKGDRAGVDRHVASMQKDLDRTHWACVRASLSYAKIGDRGKAIFWFRRAQQLGNHNWFFWTRHPWAASLQRDPDFQRTLGDIKRDLDAVRTEVLAVYDSLCGQARISPRVSSLLGSGRSASCVAQALLPVCRPSRPSFL